MIIERANRHLGEVIGNTYYTHRNKYHFFRKYNGFGISDDILNELKELGVIWIVIVYNGIEGERKFRFKLKQYLESYKVYLYTDPLQRFGGQPDLQRFVDITEVYEEETK
jgi:hypothetical protein